MTTESPAHPEAVVRKRKGVQTVWIIPIVAALVGGWLWFRALQEQGPTITILFATADGLEAGKSKVKYRDLEVGKVTAINLDPSRDGVEVTVEMNPSAKPYMVDQTRFWVVKPRIGSSGVSGLLTIVSGSYIALEVSDTGNPTKSFIGLEEPPTRPATAEGLRIKLHAASLGSISAGTGVSHLEIKMGEVDSYTYLRDPERIEFNLFIEPEYAGLVRQNTRFWNSSGFDIKLSADGFDIHAESLESIIMGGIAFGNAPGEAVGPPAADGDIFQLVESESEAQEVRSDPRHTIAYFHEPIGGLTVGSAVTFQGIEIGEVLKLDVELDVNTGQFRMPVVMETYAKRLLTEGEDLDEPHAVRLKRLVDRGLRARLGPANLLTGARSVVAIFRPETPVEYSGGPSDLPEIPTVPSTGGAISEMIEKLPTIVADLETTMEGVSKMVNSDDTKEMLASLRASSDSLKTLMAEVSAESEPLLASAKKLIEDVDKVVSNFGEDSPKLMATIQETADSAQAMLESGEKSVPVIQQELVMALREVAAGMRSLADLADTLERQPEALLKGKSNSGGR